jgi:hypothetical protein
MTILINLFIVCYIIFAWGWSYPGKMPAKKLLMPLSYAVNFIGLSHSWRLFAPNPIHATLLLTGIITLDDTSVLIWKPVGAVIQNHWQGFLYARERKWQQFLLTGKANYIYLSLCEHLVSVCRHAGHSPVSVRLVKHECPVSLPGSPPGAETSSVIYTWTIRHGDNDGEDLSIE